MKTLLPITVLLACASAASLHAATFDSGSDGSDGALVIAGAQGWIPFDPDDFDPVLDADRDGVYHFTSITIGAGTTVWLRGDVLGQKPVIWLASDDVVIAGTIGLYNDGAIPGAGGFWGGVRLGLPDGQGPGGTVAATIGYAEYPSDDHINAFLVPLAGGSGQGADFSHSNDGSGGSGALLLASSRKIDFNDGAISGYYGASVRLIANEISGEGSMIADRVRLEAFHHNHTGFISGDVRYSRPGLVFYDNPIKIILVDEQPVANHPGANKNAPDAEIDNSGLSTIMVECSQIPPGTTIRVVGWNETYGEVEATTSPLFGTLEASTATCEMVIPPGHTTFMAQAILE